MRYPRNLFVGFLLLALFAAGCTQESVKVPPETAEPAIEIPEAVVPFEGLKDAVTRVADRATGAVVSIQTTRWLSSDEKSLWVVHGFGVDRRVKKIGSGLIYRPDGIILTNGHVVRRAKQIRVTLAGGKVLDAQVVGTDQLTDLAVLKVDEKDLPTLPLSRDGGVAIGQWVVAVGSPFGLSGSVTVGVVSGVGRKDMGFQRYEQFIQTDAAINEGNSGGPLLDLSGRVVGINTAIVAGGTGVGFAIPAAMAHEVAEHLLAKGFVPRGYLGVQIQDMDENLAVYFALPDEGAGVLVNKVNEGAAADRAGVQDGDVIIGFDDTRLEGSTHLQIIVAQAEPGTKHHLAVWRRGLKVVLPVTLDQLPEERDIPSDSGEAGADRFGLSVVESKREKKAGDPPAPFVAISSIAIGSPAEKGGLTIGDVILNIEGRGISNRVNYDQIVEGFPRGAMALFAVEREGVLLHRAVRAP